MTRRRHVAGPVGSLLLESDDGAVLTAVRFVRLVVAADALVEDGGPNDRAPVLLETERQLAEYFAGTRTSFDLPTRARGTRFQQDVWAALTEIPHGTTWSYRQVARQVGRPHATRAVGSACRRNPLPVVVPCHRVVGTDGSLTGYAGGIGIKRFLLALEVPAPRADTLGVGGPMAPVA